MAKFRKAHMRAFVYILVTYTITEESRSYVCALLPLETASQAWTYTNVGSYLGCVHEDAICAIAIILSLFYI